MSTKKTAFEIWWEKSGDKAGDNKEVERRAFEAGQAEPSKNWKLEAALQQASLELDEAANIIHGAGLPSVSSLFRMAARKAANIAADAAENKGKQQ